MEEVNILIVEDEAITAMELKINVKKWGYNVIDVVNEGRMAIDCSVKNRPDLILMDIFLLDDIDGICATKEIHQNLVVPIIYLTASEDPETYKRAQETNFHDYITKPYQSNVLEKSIATLFN